MKKILGTSVLSLLLSCSIVGTTCAGIEFETQVVAGGGNDDPQKPPA